MVPFNRKQREFERRRMLAVEFGNWIAYFLGLWDWFINPITFRDRHHGLQCTSKPGDAPHDSWIGSAGTIKLFAPDSRLKDWKPPFRGRRDPGPPVPEQALAEIKDFLSEIQEAADWPIRTMIAEEFGGAGGGAITRTCWLRT
jgi:hypothetical protein